MSKDNTGRYSTFECEGKETMKSNQDSTKMLLLKRVLTLIAILLMLTASIVVDIHLSREHNLKYSIIAANSTANVTYTHQ